MLSQSGLDNEWWADSMECRCNLPNVQDLLSDGRTPYERRFGMTFNGPIIPCGAMVECHPISAKDQSRLHQFAAKVLPGIFLGYTLYAEGILEGDIMATDIEELEEMDASELLNAKEVLTPMKGDNFIFPFADGTVETSGGEQSENVHLDPGSSETRRRTRNTSRKVSSKTTRRGMMRELKMTSGRSQENSFIVITLYPESNCTYRKKKHFLFR